MSERTFTVVGEPLPDISEWHNVTYISRDRLIECLRLLGQDKPGYYDGSEPYDPERLHGTAVNLLLAYICDYEITDLFNQVPAL